MKSRRPTYIQALVVLVAMAAPAGLAAQEQQHEKDNHHTRYKLIDLGTLGGPHS